KEQNKAPTKSAAAKPKEPKTLKLPVAAGSPAEVGRLARELELLDDALLQLGLRSGGTEVKMPKTSHLMDLTIQENKLNLLHQEDREQLRAFLETVKEHSPVLHVSFNADPPPNFTEELVTWLRREIHPTLLLTIGLQPNIGAGCIVRSTNKYFDFSLRSYFDEKRDVLVEKLAVPPTAPPPAPAAAAPAAQEVHA
ncbi:MAG TPA: hypothetical protein VHA37_02410, partial [Candidatus Saccharimonadales bacterium]|nr:hypothetical protein [Candidatus Saccharimonadales bacterium]